MNEELPPFINVSSQPMESTELADFIRDWESSEVDGPGVANEGCLTPPPAIPTALIFNYFNQ
jgi:hypothetical protein